jgi:hypothetical protein
MSSVGAFSMSILPVASKYSLSIFFFLSFLLRDGLNWIKFGSSFFFFPFFGSSTLPSNDSSGEGFEA